MRHVSVRRRVVLLGAAVAVVAPLFSGAVGHADSVGVSATNGKITYQDAWNPGVVYLADPDGQYPVQIDVGADIAWAPDGNRYAHTLENSALVTERIDGSDRVVLVESPGRKYPAWTADGSAIFYVDDNALHFVSADGSERGEVFAPEPGLTIGAPAVAPQGTIAFDLTTENLERAIYTYRIGDDEPTLLIEDGGNPDYSPDGSTLVYEGGSAYDHGIVVANADGTDPEQLPWYGEAQGNPVWSPDGAFVLSVAYLRQWSWITVINVDTDEQRVVASDGFGPVSWQPVP